jgi:hypothetical protein
VIIQSEFRLRKVVKELYEKCNKSWYNLETFIKDANGGKLIVGRKKLQRLVEKPADDKISFRIEELRAIDNALPYEQSLCSLPLFTRVENFLDHFKSHDGLTVVVGSAYLPSLNAEAVNHWDVQSFGELLNSNEVTRKKVKLEEAFHRGNNCDKILKEKKDDWIRCMDSDDSVLALGTPFVCHGTEILLAKMFGVKPFQPPRASDKLSLPFYFIWPNAAHRRGIDKCAFLLEKSVYEKHYPKDTDRITRDDRAFVINGKLYKSSRYGTCYGLVVAQRQISQDRFFCTVIGTNGPTTFGATKVITDSLIDKALPPITDDEIQPVVITVVKTEVGQSDDRDGGDDKQEDRKLLKWAVEEPILIWTYRDGNWTLQDSRK